MTTDSSRCRATLTTGQTIDRLRELQPDPALVYYLYVVDARALDGNVSLRDLVVASPDTPLTKIMKSERAAGVEADVPKEEVASLIAKYDLLAFPVVDARRVLLGTVTVDDVVELMMPRGGRRGRSGPSRDDLRAVRRRVLRKARVPPRSRGSWGRRLITASPQRRRWRHDVHLGRRALRLRHALAAPAVDRRLSSSEMCARMGRSPGRAVGSHPREVRVCAGPSSRCSRSSSRTATNVAAEYAGIAASLALIGVPSSSRCRWRASRSGCSVVFFSYRIVERALFVVIPRSSRTRSPRSSCIRIGPRSPRVS